MAFLTRNGAAWREAIGSAVLVLAYPLRRKSVAMSKTLWLLPVLLLASFNLADAQQPKKVPRLGYLTNNDVGSDSTRAEAIRLALLKRGYIEGQNIATEYQYANGKSDRLPELATELVRLKVDIIVAAGAGTVKAAKNATKTIPIVMMGTGSDPVEAGLIESLASPGGNVTGITNLTRQLGGKRLELLREVVPKLARVAVLYNPATRSNVLEVKEVLPAAARALGLTVRSWEVRGTDGFEKVFTALSKERTDGLYVLGSALMDANQKRIIGFALKSRLPSVHNTREAVEAGALMCYGADQADSHRRVAYYVDKILKGAKPADLPVEQPTKVELAINLQTAKKIGLTIPPDVLARADKVISDHASRDRSRFTAPLFP
jgi:putative tryptophan/tyrosine transport system substrate-binding protein